MIKDSQIVFDDFFQTIVNVVNFQILSQSMQYCSYGYQLLSTFKMSELTHRELMAKYEVIRVLGEGSFGKVFLVRDVNTCNQDFIVDQQLAMKKYSRYQIIKFGKQSSLVRSTMILEALSHHNIINFKHLMQEGDQQFFLLYEACTKGSLENLKKRINLDKVEYIQEIMYQLAQALIYLKSVSVAHRDIKPSNISFNSNGELKVIDFDEAVCYDSKILNTEKGLAKKLFVENQIKKLNSRRSRATSYVGTEMYMSPEMRKKSFADQRGDIWAFGCILYELMSSQNLIIDGEDEDDVLQNKINEYLMLLKQKISGQTLSNKYIVSGFDLIKKVLRPNPNDRLHISEIINHQFFDGYPQIRGRVQNKFKKFLRANTSLFHPSVLQQALSNDLIGMRGGKQKFQFLKNIPVFVNFQEQKPTKGTWSFKCICKALRGQASLSYPSIYYILGGACYLKLKNPCYEDDKLYIEYADIDSISIVQNQIVIKTSKQLQETGGQAAHKIFYLQFVTGEELEQTKLFMLLTNILKD